MDSTIESDLVLRGTSTPHSIISDISNDTALSRNQEHASFNLFWFGAGGINKKMAAGSTPEFKQTRAMKAKQKPKQNAKHAAPERGTLHHSRQSFSAVVTSTMGRIKQKVADRDNTARPSEFESYESETPPCKLSRENSTCKIPRHNI